MYFFICDIFILLSLIDDCCGFFRTKFTLKSNTNTFTDMIFDDCFYIGPRA
mgnify:CR=1 FL=1